MRYLEELKKLNLPVDKFAVFGSGSMAIYGIRENGDLDIIVKMDLWNELVKKFEFKKGRDNVLVVGEIEIFRDWFMDEFGGVDKYIDSADIIDGIRFVKLIHIIEWKKKRGNEKDLKDIELIEEFLESKS